jgi:hypothetical protein
VGWPAPALSYVVLNYINTAGDARSTRAWATEPIEKVFQANEIGR